MLDALPLLAALGDDDSTEDEDPMLQLGAALLVKGDDVDWPGVAVGSGTLGLAAALLATEEAGEEAVALPFQLSITNDRDCRCLGRR